MTTKVEYTVYETIKDTLDPNQALRVGHPVAHYTDYTQMVDDWLWDIVQGTHVFVKSTLEK
jgi:hypothetical protein